MKCNIFNKIILPATKIVKFENKIDCLIGKKSGKKEKIWPLTIFSDLSAIKRVFKNDTCKFSKFFL
jgi:hypothetical protein